MDGTYGEAQMWLNGNPSNVSQYRKRCMLVLSYSSHTRARRPRCVVHPAVYDAGCEARYMDRS